MADKRLSLLILCSSLLILITGLTSKLSLGDEVYHYRFAKDIFNSGKRAVSDSLYGKEIPPGYFYSSEPFWHTLLALLWRLFGRVSFTLAQFYQAMYYALLLLFTYLLGKELYGQTQGFYSALIVATIPVIVVFSIVFYLDIPAAALSTLCFYLIVKRRFFWSAVTLGIMYLTKRNTYFFLPAFFVMIFYYSEANLRQKIKNLSYFLATFILFILPDILWRRNHLKSAFLTDKGEMIPGNGDLTGIKNRFISENLTFSIKERLNSSLFNPTDIVKYFGIVLLILLVMYVLFKKYEKRDRILLLSVGCYFLFFCYVFKPYSDLRYLLPVVPLLAILSSKAVSIFVNKKSLKILVIFLCLSQFVSTALYVRAKRQIPQGIKEGFVYLKNNTSPDDLIIYPEYVILEEACRKFAWLGNLRGVVSALFWNKDEEETKKLLKSFNVNFIAVKKSRIYDDSNVRHYGGYPKSFVERLPGLSYVKLVFNNEEMSIWKINPNN